jgi:hypothetical protein
MAKSGKCYKTPLEANDGSLREYVAPPSRISLNKRRRWECIPTLLESVAQKSRTVPSRGKRFNYEIEYTVPVVGVVIATEKLANRLEGQKNQVCRNELDVY